jgi:DNA-binding NtrC family response regulator
MYPKILVVSNDSKSLKTMLEVLTGAGYEANGATSFMEGKRLLGERSPDLLIADERLEAFNGMHLILRGRFFEPELQAIVVGASESAGLEAEARRLNIPSVVRPSDPTEWPVLISEVFGRDGVSYESWRANGEQLSHGSMQ